MTGSWLSPAHQAYRIRQAVPGAICRFPGDGLVCTATLQPTELSSVYTVQVRYQHGDRPTTRVLAPVLRLRPAAAGLPHVYTGDELCLYVPGEWDPSMSIGHTILPWASEWLFHYEMWLATGKWTGGGRHPSRPR
jgi:hypothetical protein